MDSVDPRDSGSASKMTAEVAIAGATAAAVISALSSHPNSRLALGLEE